MTKNKISNSVMISAIMEGTMKKILLISLIVMSLLLATIPVAAVAAADNVFSYSDISGKWFTEAVTKYGFMEIFADSSGKFNPNNKITRIEFARLLHTALGISINYFAAPNVGNDFNDMKNTDVGANALIDLATTGIIERGGSFNPQQPLDREVMIHWMMNALRYKNSGFDVIIKYAPIPFSDDQNISDTYKSDVVKSVILKLIFGRSNNMLFPKDGATRAEAVTVVSRLLPLIISSKSVVDISAAAHVVNGALEMSLTIRNNSDKPVTIAHTSGQHYDFRLFNINGEAVYFWSMGKLFTMNTESTVIKAGEKVVYTDTLDSAAYAALKDKVVTMRAYIVGTSGNFAIDENGYLGTITVG